MELVNKPRVGDGSSALQICTYMYWTQHSCMYVLKSVPFKPTAYCRPSSWGHAEIALYYCEKWQRPAFQVSTHKGLLHCTAQHGAGTPTKRHLLRTSAGACTSCTNTTVLWAQTTWNWCRAFFTGSMRPRQSGRCSRPNDYKERFLEQECEGV